ncbi:hypothetical protein RM69_05625, partial [Mesotoga sp. SC_NapDC3]
MVGKSTLNQNKLPCEAGMLSLMLLSVDGSLLLDGQDRQSVETGKSVKIRDALGGRWIVTNT